MPSAPPAAPIPLGPVPVPKPSIHQAKDEFGLLSASDVGRVVRAIPVTTFVVEGLLPRASINLLVGDSGIGKSPLAYQLALSVAAGIPFLGLPVSPKSKV